VASPGEEALRMGLANRLVPTGKALEGRPRSRTSSPRCRRRCSQRSAVVLRAVVPPLDEALGVEYRHGMATRETGEMFAGLDDYA
jgi:enoyl-CoA hydratase/carnithine racemase